MSYLKTNTVKPLPTEAEVAASPAVKRLEEVMDVLNSGDPAVMLAYLDANAVEPKKRFAPGPLGLPVAGQFLDIHRRSRGFDLIRVARVEDMRAVAVVRNRLTGRYYREDVRRFMATHLLRDDGPR